MNYLHPVFALCLFLEAFAVLWLINQWFRIEPVSGHAPEIDGLRGLLAFGVFVHHASIWYFFLQTGRWVVPESRLYTHLGQSTVSLFFMITGFLFFGKLMNSRSVPIDWLRLYVSRCLRILPLYLLVMLMGAVLIAFIRYSGWLEPMAQPWNEKSLIGLFTAGVTWTLSYEWKFYYALPLWALLYGRVPLTWLMFSLGMLFISGISKALDIHALTFLSGALAVALKRLTWWQQLSRSVLGNLLALFALVAAVVEFDSAYAFWSLILLTVFFCLISNGAGCWGLLRTTLARVFGEITYSIYLLHGPVLFVFFRFGLDFQAAAQLTPLAYWLTIAALVPVLLLVSVLSFRWIEQPSMRKVSALTAWIQRTVA
ncbi:MAG: acyltransferase [Pseudomonadota bacterium]